MIKSLDDSIYREIVAIVNRGISKSRIKNYEEAIVFYYQALELFPKNEQEYIGQKYLYELIAKSYEEYGDLNRAIKYFKKAEQCYEGKKDTNILLKLAFLYYQIKHNELSEYYNNLCIKYGENGLVDRLNTPNKIHKDETFNTSTIYKTIKGKTYTFDEWKAYENEQWKIYQEKKKNNKKLFGFLKF